MQGMDLGISGRRAAIAAASKGLGFGTAAALVTEGVHVAICGRDKAAVESAVERLRAMASQGANVVGLVADVGTSAGGAAFMRDAAAALAGPLDIVVANAGGPPLGSFASNPVEAYTAALELSLLSVVGMAKEALPGMNDRGWGRFVAITSLSVRQPIPPLILSNTARAGVTGFLKTTATEVAKHGVTVNSVQPGLHATERMNALGDPKTLSVGIPAGRIGDPGDFGAVAAFLCSQQAGFITGTHVLVDGGAYAGLM